MNRLLFANFDFTQQKFVPSSSLIQDGPNVMYLEETGRPEQTELILMELVFILSLHPYILTSLHPYILTSCILPSSEFPVNLDMKPFFPF